MDLRTRFTLFFSLISFLFLAAFSTIVYQLVRSKTLAHEQQSLVGFLEHEWEHIDLPDHQAKAKPGVPHFKDVYLRIRKEGVILYDSFQKGVGDPPKIGIDVETKRIFHSLSREHNGHKYEVTGYFDLISTLDYLRLLKNILLMGSLGSLLILIPLSGWATRFLLKPFRRLADQTSKINAEQLSYRFDTPKYQDEHGLLARNFNSLLDRLERSFLSVRRFASNASHELRTPLAVIIGQAEMALRREREPNEYRAVISKTLERAKDLRDIINRLLYLAEVEHLEEVERETIGAKEFVTEIATTLSQAYQAEGKTLIVDESAPDLDLRANRQMLGSIVTNLAENALKYSNGRAEISWSASEGMLLLNLNDDGPGIPEDKKGLVFEPFIKLPQKKDGQTVLRSHGLGLSIVRACLHSLKGTIELGKSSLGGLFVQVRVPLMLFFPLTALVAKAAPSGLPPTFPFEFSANQTCTISPTESACGQSFGQKGSGKDNCHVCNGKHCDEVHQASRLPPTKSKNSAPK